MLKIRIYALFIIVTSLVVAGSLTTPGLADGGANHQVRNQHFGVSGGNVDDATRRFCCSGTLGSLLTDGTNQYILSNNHVLARSDQANLGDDISQPGLIDNNCRISTVVADFTLASPLGSNVDAAIAQLRPGPMDSSGFIEDLGVPASAVVAPSVGLSVAKSGRTTGFTTGTIGSINTSVNVQYQRSCGQGKKFVVAYTNQVVINSSTFSAGGDSGSLIVSNSGHNPVALLFAGSSTTTIGNPVGEVLTKLTMLLGPTLSFVGSGAPFAPAIQDLQLETQPFLRGVGGEMKQLPQQAADRASAVLELHRNNLMATPGVIGAGIGAAADNDLEAVIVVYVDKTASARPQFAPALDGVKVKLVYTDPFVAF
jgi:Peptidase family S64